MKYSIPHKKKKIAKRIKNLTSTAVMLPEHHLANNEVNLRGMTNDDLVRDFQYPDTIYRLLKRIQESRLVTLLNDLSPGKEPEASFLDRSFENYYSKPGCLRWVYTSNYINDGQERFEASDDVSFDVRGNFCADCELARRMVELRPVIYETPEPNQTPEIIKDGFTEKSWEWNFRPLVGRCVSHVLDDKTVVCELSSDYFIHILSLVNSVRNIPSLREICYTFRCGDGVIDVSERMNQEERDIDMTQGIIEQIRRLETPFVAHDTEFQIMFTELNPFVSGHPNDECFYDPHLRINPNSRVIHSGFIRMKLPNGRKYIFSCPDEYAGMTDYSIIKSLDTFPDLELYYPALFYSLRGFGVVFVYCVMFLMENHKGSFHDILNNREEFRSICKPVFTEDDAERLRGRLVMMKSRASNFTFPRSLSVIRNCLIGLRLYTE